MSVDYTIPKDEIRAGQFEIDGDVFVRIVRCRDCKYADPEPPSDRVSRRKYQGGFWCEYWTEGIGAWCEPDGFCAWGERKVEG